MPTRREALRILGAMSAMAGARGWAADASASRSALVIGNASYRPVPLPNPANDARAIARLFTQGGMGVDLRIDATRDQMLSAIEHFGAGARDGQVKQLFFYYAGHGVQLDWRNYLLPVDAEVMSEAQVRARCVDLGILFDHFTRAKDRTKIVILDACRNDPFGSGYRPEQKGLSQFDAPPGTLLAYATAPGNTASDGTGDHGLYTENLVRELSIRGNRIEDAFKRVRLNVRLASRGAQVPWETTSLESDVFVLEDARNGPSSADRKKELEEDLATWEQIQASKKLADWVAYLRRFPNGQFSEIAQIRLTRLLGEEAERAKAAQPALPRIRTDDEYDALPAGSLYLDPNGNTRRKSR